MVRAGTMAPVPAPGRTQEEVGVPHWQAAESPVSITIAKGNSRVLDCMRHDWQSATAGTMPVLGH